MSRPTIQQGVNDSYDVRLLQQLLRDLGHHHHQIDGDFGPRTAESLMEYQTRHGITDPPGVCSDQTWASLQGQFGELEGLRSQENIEEFVADTYGTANSSMVAADRLTELAAAANEQLADAGVPEVAFVFEDVDALGTFSWWEWKVRINETKLENAFNPDHDEHDPADALDTIYHESRHAEQFWLVARYLAGVEGLDAGAIHERTDIPLTVCERAVADPILTSDATTQRTIDWYESVFGAGSEHRNATLSDGGSRTDYRELPEEADAWDTGGRVQEAYQDFEDGEDDGGPRPVLRPGSANASEVRYLQQLLEWREVVIGEIDGDFGPTTRRAVEAFQQAHGLRADGVVGRQTWEALIP